MKKIISFIIALFVFGVAHAETAAQMPTKIQLPWAANAGGSYKRTIPVPSQIGIQNGAASWSDGYPPLNFTPIAAGGVPPYGQDTNGALNSISALSMWYNMGGPINYDATFQTAIGGYPKGAILQSAVTVGLLWVNTVDNNLTNPDASGAGWTSYTPQYATNATNATNVTGSGTISATTTGGGSLTVFQAAVAITQPIGDYSTKIANTAFVNPGSYIAANGYTKLPSGLIIQWGTVSVGATSTTTVNFPISFPTACFSVTSTLSLNTLGGQSPAWSTYILSASQFNAVNGSTGALSYYWMAIGH